MFRKFSINSYRSVFGAVLLSAALGGGCAMISGKEKNLRENNRDDSVKSGRTVTELVGKWRKKQANPYAEYAENTGSFETYEISADGRVLYESLTAVKIYDCLVEDSARAEGTIFVESGSKLNITLDVGRAEHRDFCAPEKNHTEPTRAAVADFDWKINRPEDDADELCLTGNNGETACYLRVE